MKCIDKNKHCLLTVCVQYSFSNQFFGSNVNYVRHYDVLCHNYIDCMYTIFVSYPTAKLRVGDTKLHDYQLLFGLYLELELPINFL